jgi:hypothetical protein
MLIHMTPGEVGGLQALALKHGGSLTINPDTGLPEAKFLKKLLPALIGFGLNMFAPGLGSAVGAALGTSAAVGTGIAVGGFETLRTGSLSKGLSAGLGAYGGAGLASSMSGVGVGAAQQGAMGALTQDQIAAQMANSGGTFAFDGSGLTEQGVLNQAAADATKTALLPANAGKTLSAGFDAVTKDPAAFGQFAKDNWKYGLAAASPIIADSMVPTSTKMPTAQSTGYIRPYDYDPVGQTFKRLDPVLASDLAAKPPPGMARGGLIALAEGGNPADDPYARYNTLSGQSKAAYDYLMGNTASSAVAPVAAIQPPAPTPAPAATTTPATTTTTTSTTGGGEGGGGGGGGGGINRVVSSIGSEPEEPVMPSPDEDFPSTYPEPVMPSPDEDFPSTYPEPEMPSPDEDFPSTYPEPEMPSPDVDFPSTYPEPEMPSPDVDFPSTYFEPVMPSPDEDFPSTSLDQPYDNTEYEVQPWENVDNSGYTDNSMAADNSLNSGNNTYTGIPSESPEGMPDAFGSYPGESTYIGDTGGAGTIGGGSGRFIEVDENPDEDSYDYMGMASGGMVPGYADGGVFGIGGGNGMTSTPSVNPNSSGGFSRGLAGMFGGGQLQQPAQQPAQQNLPVGYNEAPSRQYANGGIAGYASGGISHLGGYSDGGRLLRGPGDGVSDSIPASIGKRRQPARLADGEFVVPARIVSELGNGSTEAGARKLYAMMDRIQKARGKTVGKGKVAANSRSDKHLPA